MPVNPEPLTRIGQPPAAPQQPRRSKKPLLIAAAGLAALVVLALVAGGVYLFAWPKDFDARGTLQLQHPATVKAECVGQGGYSDIRVGVQVVVTDASGTTVGIGRVEKFANKGLFCAYEFLVPDVPAGLGFYGVEVSKRGRVQYDEERLRAGVTLTLGAG